MADSPKTVPTDADPHAYLAQVTPERRRRDAERMLDMMERITGQPPVMWGPSIVGFGSMTYTYASGRTGEWPPVGFSARKTALTLYLWDGVEEHPDELALLGPHRTGKACLYLADLDRVDLSVLESIVTRAWRSAHD